MAETPKVSTGYRTKPVYVACQIGNVAHPADSAEDVKIYARETPERDHKSPDRALELTMPPQTVADSQNDESVDALAAKVDICNHAASQGTPAKELLDQNNRAHRHLRRIRLRRRIGRNRIQRLKRRSEVGFADMKDPMPL